MVKVAKRRRKQGLERGQKCVKRAAVASFAGDGSKQRKTKCWKRIQPEHILRCSMSSTNPHFENLRIKQVRKPTFSLSFVLLKTLMF
jgi:hypothetical protein